MRHPTQPIRFPLTPFETPSSYGFSLCFGCLSRCLAPASQNCQPALNTFSASYPLCHQFRTQTRSPSFHFNHHAAPANSPRTFPFSASPAHMVQTRFQSQFQGVKSFDLALDKHDNTPPPPPPQPAPMLKSENFDDTLSCSEFASTTASFYSEGTPLREGSLEATIKVETLVEQLDDYECSTLDSLNARWPSIRARLKGMKPHLPKKTDDKPTLVLDLDETLLHTYRDETAGHSEPDYIIYASENANHIITAGTLRPGVQKFLKWASEIFEVVVWTAGDDAYAATVMDILDADREYISHVLGRSACIQTRIGANGECMYVKDLCALGRDLSRTFMVDNAPHAATLNLSNLIPIESFYGQTTDHELEQLKQFLESKLTHRKDMRIILHRQFNLKRKLRQRINDWKHAGVSLRLEEP